MSAKEKELIKAQKDYIEFLGKCYDQAFRMAHVHGYRVNENDIITGIKMRDKITECEGKIKTSELDKALDLLEVRRSTSEIKEKIAEFETDLSDINAVEYQMNEGKLKLAHSAVKGACEKQIELLKWVINE